ncbi:hypothetical protein [Algoriphagus boritolerans]|uniref:hypothetical protein n=1 Tax=Algoriphagus boritolerans TaxID=308111 RepID=UPI000ACF4CE1
MERNPLVKSLITNRPLVTSRKEDFLILRKRAEKSQVMESRMVREIPKGSHLGKSDLTKARDSKRSLRKKDGADYPKKSFGDKPGRFKKRRFYRKEIRKT